MKTDLVFEPSLKVLGFKKYLKTGIEGFKV
jgi:hypothetical protein